MDVCARLGIRDPAEFYALPLELQGLWLEWAAADWSGAWLSTPKPATKALTPAELEAHREEIRRAPVRRS